MYLKEHFLSIQGEGRYRGELSIFIRFAKCNRDCSNLKVKYKVGDTIKYGCDSYDSVDVYFKNKWQKVNLDKLIKITNSYNCKNVVITGGEPLLNIKDKDFIGFVSWLNQNNYKITIETNGDINIPDSVLNTFNKVIFSISPKEIIREKKYWHLNTSSYIKSIYNFSNITTEYLNELKKKNLDIFIMPKGETSEIVESQRREVFEYCLRNNFNFTDREHLHIFKHNAMEESEITKNIQ